MRLDDEASDRRQSPADGGVLLAHASAEPTPATVRVAAGIATARGSRLLALRVAGANGATAAVDGVTAAVEGATADEASGEATDETADWTDGSLRDRVDVATDTDLDRPAVRAVLDAVERHDAGVLVVPSRGTGGLGAVDRLLAAVPCDVVVVGGRTRESAVASILAPVAGGPHSGFVLDVAGAVAAATGAWIDVLHVVDSGADAAERAEAEAYLASALGRLSGDVRADTWLLDAGDPADAIVDQSTYYDLTVVGAPRKGKLRRFLYGSTATAVRREAESATVTARRADGRSVLDRWL